VLNVTLPELNVQFAVLDESIDKLTGLLDPPPVAATAKLLPTVAVVGGAGLVNEIACGSRTSTVNVAVVVRP